MERSSIIETLRESDKAMTPNQIATAIGDTKPVNVRNLLKRMLSDGLVEKVGYGRYELSKSDEGIGESNYTSITRLLLANLAFYDFFAPNE